MTAFPLAWKSLRNRRVTAALTVLSIAASVALLLGVERLRSASRTSFASAVSGTDLIVGARTSRVHLLLSSVFHLGDAANNIRWDSYRDVAENPAVRWTIPISLGDSHRGYRVVGTTGALFEHFRYARDRGLVLAVGEAFGADDEAVLGAEVARTLGYGVGSSMVVAHGAGDVTFVEHADHPFEVVGILKPTGTPLDRCALVSLEGIEAMHEGLHEGASEAGFDPLAEVRTSDLRHAGRSEHVHDGSCSQGEYCQHDPDRAITAFFVGLETRGAALGVQRMVNDYEEEPLTAILPGVALQELWQMVGVVEKTLFVVGAMVVVVGLLGMLASLLTSLRERRREMAILRAVGARPAQVFALLLGEAFLLTGLGVVLGILLLNAGLLLAEPLLASRFGLQLSRGLPNAREFLLTGLLLAAGALVGVWPALRMYRQSLADGLTVRL